MYERRRLPRPFRLLTRSCSCEQDVIITHEKKYGYHTEASPEGEDGAGGGEETKGAEGGKTVAEINMAARQNSRKGKKQDTTQYLYVTSTNFGNELAAESTQSNTPWACWYRYCGLVMERGKGKVFGDYPWQAQEKRWSHPYVGVVWICPNYVPPGFARSRKRRKNKSRPTVG